MDKELYNFLRRNYENACRAYVLHLSQKLTNDLSVCADNVSKDYKTALDMLRKFLDANGFKMPRPKWIYNDKDETTWMYTYRQGLNTKFNLLRWHRK